MRKADIAHKCKEGYGWKCHNTATARPVNRQPEDGKNQGVGVVKYNYNKSGSLLSILSTVLLLSKAYIQFNDVGSSVVLGGHGAGDARLDAV